MAKLILGITGEIGSGKGIITKHIEQNYKADSHKFSNMLRDILKRLYLDESRENISILSLILRKNFGEDIMAKVMYHDAYADKSDIVVIDGIRRMEDMQYLRELDYFKLVYVEADIETRYERIRKRKENADEIQEEEKTFEEFRKDHELETELRIRDLKNYADYVIENDGTYVELYSKIDEILNGLAFC